MFSERTEPSETTKNLGECDNLNWISEGGFVLMFRNLISFFDPNDDVCMLIWELACPT